MGLIDYTSKDQFSAKTAELRERLARLRRTIDLSQNRAQGCSKSTPKHLTGPHPWIVPHAGFLNLPSDTGEADALSRTAERVYGHFAEELPMEDTLVKLSDSDSRFIVQMLELRRAAMLDIEGRSPQQSKLRALELKRLDAVLTQIKAELPLILDPEIAEAVKLVRSL
jgi:hypothetical protein